MRFYVPTILPTLLPLLHSPLTAPVMKAVFLELGKSAFKEQKRLGKCVYKDLKFAQNFEL